MRRTTAVLVVVAALILALAFVVGCPQKQDPIGELPPMDDPGRELGPDAGEPVSGKLAELVSGRTAIESYEVTFEGHGEAAMDEGEAPGKMLVQLVDGKQARMKMEHEQGWVIMDSAAGFMIAYDSEQGQAMKLPMQEGESFDLDELPMRVDDIDADVEVLRTETIDGVVCYVVETALPNDDEKATFYVDKEFGLIRKIENPEGSMVFKYSRINELTDADFEVPAGVKVEDMAEMMKGLEGMTAD